VDLRERLGGVAYDYLSATTGERLIVETRGDDFIASGTNVVIDFTPETAMFFDATTEARLR
jgi:lactose/L-arabinose transport system ATP-binding protein